MRGTAVPYHRGAAELYHDPVKDHWRLTSFDVADTHEGLRENLERFYAASVWAEILLKSHGGGEDSEALFDLAAEALAKLSRIPGDIVDRLTVLFLWRFLEIDGVQPDPDCCGNCGKRLGNEEATGIDSGGMLSGACCAGDTAVRLPAGSRRWLASAEGKSLDDVLRTGLPDHATAAAREWLLTLVQTLLERPLRSLVGTRRGALRAAER